MMHRTRSQPKMPSSLRESANRMLSRLSESLTATTTTESSSSRQQSQSKSLRSSTAGKNPKRSASWGILRLSSTNGARISSKGGNLQLQQEEPHNSSRTSHTSTGCSSTTATDEGPSSSMAMNAWDDTANREFRQSIIELPGTANFASNHVLINQERIRQGKAPLDRSRELDDLARTRAQEMARRGSVFQKLERIATETMAENAQRGSSIRFVHQMIVGGVSGDGERETMLSDEYVKFGVGCATGEDGMIYMSQIFEAPEEEEEEPEQPPQPRSSFFQKLPKARLPGRTSMIKNPLVYLQKKTKRTRRRNNLHHSQ